MSFIQTVQKKDLCLYGSICIHYIHTVCVAVQPLRSITLVNPIGAHCRSDRLCSVRDPL